MPAARFLLLLIALLLLAGRSRAQSRPTPADGQVAAPARPVAPPPSGRQVTVNVEVPKAVGFISDCAKIVFSRQDDGRTAERLMQRFRTRKERQVLSLKVDVPTNKVTKTLGIVE